MLVFNAPFDLRVEPFIQLTALLDAGASYAATLDLSHTATFSISVPAGDTFSTILGSATPVPEPGGLEVLAVSFAALAATRRAFAGSERGRRRAI